MHINFMYFGDNHTEFCLVGLIGLGFLRHSHVTQVDLKFAMKLKWTLNSQPSCLHLLCSGVIGICPPETLL